jgi:two-component system sensor histidine kinase MtrB
MANLIGNALKHGGSPVRVTIREEPGPAAGEGDIVIAVSDAGPGIPVEVLPHVFDRFYKADASRARSEGSGLGLSIAMENAHIHGGDISAANAPGGGAVFTLRLPRRPRGDSADGEGSEGSAGPDDGGGAR